MASDQFGSAVGAAGDVNGDGVGDLVVGAWRPATTAASFTSITAPRLEGWAARKPSLKLVKTRGITLAGR